MGGVCIEEVVKRKRGGARNILNKIRLADKNYV